MHASLYKASEERGGEHFRLLSVKSETQISKLVQRRVGFVFHSDARSGQFNVANARETGTTTPPILLNPNSDQQRLDRTHACPTVAYNCIYAHHCLTPSTAMKRKRRSNSTRDSKRQRTDEGHAAQHPIVPLLQEYYQEVHSLRTYLVSRLPKSSKKRRRRLLHYGLQVGHDDSIAVEHSVVELLDSILVGTSKRVPTQEANQLDEDISVFTQQVSESDVSISPSAGHLRQAEVGSSVAFL